MSTTKHLIKIKDLSFNYVGNNVLEDINIDIHEGDFVGIIGPNGSGKTTLLKLILKLLNPSSGEIKLFDENILKFNEWSKIGYVAQKNNLSQSSLPITVKELVMLGRATVRGLGQAFTKEDENIALKSLADVEMQEYENHLVQKLSGGQQQRVFIAKALSSRPQILILDEPTVGIDTQSEEIFYQILRRLNKSGITLVLVSHDTDTIMNEVNKVVCLNRSVCFHGAPHEFSKSEIFGELFGEHKKIVKHSH